MSNKEIAVLLPVYNYQTGLEKTLESMRSEKDLFDIVLVDDGSTPPVDLTKFNDIKIILVRHDKNLGIVKALNTGMQYIFDKGYKFIAFINSGDISINNRFRKEQDFLNNNPEVGLVSSWYRLIDNNEKPFLVISRKQKEDSEIRKYIYYENIICEPSVMLRADSAKKTGLFLEEFSYATDYEYCFAL